MTHWRGHAAPIAAMMTALSGERLHHAWLMGGPKGIGKGGIARAFARILLGARSNGLEPLEGDATARLVDAGTHPDLVILERQLREAKKGETATLARNITVDQIRGLSRFLHLAPSMARRRVIIVDAADDLERGAANALLKGLEEPPRDTVFLLVSHAPGRLLPTIRSRCRFLPFQPLNDEDMALVLSQEAPEMSDDDRAALIRNGEGSPGRALAMQGLDVAAMTTVLDRIAETGDPTHAERIALARQLAPKAAQSRFDAFLNLVPQFVAARLRIAARHEMKSAGHAFEQAIALGRGATTLSLDPAATVFALCGTVALLAQREA